jgi:hypothetical protein
VKIEQRVVDIVTALMRARITSGESLDRVGDGLVLWDAYRGRTYTNV